MKRGCRRREQKRGRRREEEGDTAVSLSDHRMCIPGDNRVYVLGLYSVEMRKRQTHCERQEQHFTTVLERKREGECGGAGERERGWGDPSNSSRQTNIQSPEHVQCAQD